MDSVSWFSFRGAESASGLILPGMWWMSCRSRTEQDELNVGTLGSLKADHAPNHTLATSDSSYLSGTGDLVTWQNVLASVIHSSPCVMEGETAVHPAHPR